MRTGDEGHRAALSPAILLYISVRALGGAWPIVTWRPGGGVVPEASRQIHNTDIAREYSLSWEILISGFRERRAGFEQEPVRPRRTPDNLVQPKWTVVVLHL